jgi:hypothetical protein
VATTGGVRKWLKPTSSKRLFDLFQWFLPSHPHPCPLPPQESHESHHEISAHHDMQLKNGMHIDLYFDSMLKTLPLIPLHTRTWTPVGLLCRSQQLWAGSGLPWLLGISVVFCVRFQPNVLYLPICGLIIQ